jgi:hypothetical protein
VVSGKGPYEILPKESKREGKEGKLLQFKKRKISVPGGIHVSKGCLFQLKTPNSIPTYSDWASGPSVEAKTGALGFEDTTRFNT